MTTPDTPSLASIRMKSLAITAAALTLCAGCINEIESQRRHFGAKIGRIVVQGSAQRGITFQQVQNCDRCGYDGWRDGI